MSAALLAFAALAGCNVTGSDDREPAVGEAWVAPATLQARKELSLRSPIALTLHHGDKVELLARRRRFLKIRVDQTEAWTDSRLLFSEDTKAEFERFVERAQKAPIIGTATVLDTITVHIAPYRQAPGLTQLQAKQSVHVIAHQRVERATWDPPPLLTEAQLKPKVVRKKKEPKVAPPPAGPPPPVPEDWLLMSGYSADYTPEDKRAAAAAATPVAHDMWSVVRLSDGRAGWVLTRLLYMAIPDEVAQYAERARIVSFFKLGEARDGDQVKPIWLWATQSSAGRDYEYDSLRIFIWSLKRHRYETSWIERGMAGAGPVVLQGKQNEPTGFTTLVWEKDGKLTRREYALQGYRARITARNAVEPQAAWYVPSTKRGAAEGLPEAVRETISLWDQVKRKVSLLRGASGR